MRFPVGFLSFLLLMALGGSYAAVAEAQTTPLITGVIRDRNTGLGIPNVRVFFYGTASGTVFTDASGAYTFTGSQ